MEITKPTAEVSDILERLLSGTVEAHGQHSHSYQRNIWFAPYGPYGIPRQSDLNVARACELGGNSVSFYFPLAFTRDLLAIRLGEGQQYVDLCAKIINQQAVETTDFGRTNLIDCRFVGRLFLG